VECGKEVREKETHSKCKPRGCMLSHESGNHSILEELSPNTYVLSKMIFEIADSSFVLCNLRNRERKSRKTKYSLSSVEVRTSHDKMTESELGSLCITKLQYVFHANNIHKLRQNPRHQKLVDLLVIVNDRFPRSNDMKVQIRAAPCAAQNTPHRR
jgi:hypothetical protein